MSHEPQDVLVGAYQDLAVAKQDFDAVTALVRDRKVRVEGVVLVEHHDDGEVSVVSTGDHLGRHGMKWGSGVGLVVGLFQPEILAAVAVGAAGGGVVGRFADHRLKTELSEKIGEALPPGSAGIITVARSADALDIQRAMSGTPAKAVVQTDERGLLKPLKDSLAEAMHKFAPDRSKLPIPDRPFGGTAGRTLRDSVADWSMVPRPKAPEGAPNVLLVLIDDAGFGAPDAFGGPVSTPAFRRVQEEGATYNRFHVTAVCSPTRAALLTGRNQHRVGFGSIAEYPGPFPGYTAARPKSCTALPRMLSENGYVTGGFGKWHLTPNNVQGAAGPFDNWPKAWGFDHWWGFLSGAAGQFDPIITMDDTVIGVQDPKPGEDEYYFPDDLTDQAIEWLHRVRAQDAEKPWFMYYSTGCAHAPHQVETEWADRYKGQFDDGWDALRERILARQKELGIVPADTELTPRPEGLPAWDDLDDTAKALYARQMEVYCGYQENADWNVGRLLDSIDEMGDRENTLVIYIWGDNGASMEGTTTGSFNELTFLNGMVLDPERQTELIEEYGGIEALGGPDTAPHCAAAWAHACNTPFQWGKQDAAHLGGTRDPMVISWPERLQPGGPPRSQFTHVVDIVPTVLEAAGIPAPDQVDGIDQDSIDGTSFLFTLDEPDAPERHTQQYFEMFGARAMYKDGWWAASRPDRLPWDVSAEALAGMGPDVDWDPDRDVGWELYDLRSDFSQARNVAAEHPDKVQELQELWWQEAERNQVLPLMAGLSVMYGILPPMPTQTRFRFHGDVDNIQFGMVPRIFGRSYAIEADLVVPEGGAEGVILAMADFMGGFGLWVDGDGTFRHTYSLVGVETYRQQATAKLPTGEVSVRMLFESDEQTPGSGGDVTLFIDGAEVGGGRMPQTVPVSFTSYAGMDVGRDNGLVVDREYRDKGDYAFTGTVRHVTFDLKPVEGERAKHTEEHGLHHHEQIQGVASGAAS